LLSLTPAPINEVFNAGVVPRLVEFLRIPGDHSLQVALLQVALCL